MKLMKTQDQIRRFVIDTFYVGNLALSDEMSLLQHGVVDSTGVLEVVAFLEQAFGVTIDDAELLPENFDSIARMAALVERKQRARP